MVLMLYVEVGEKSIVLDIGNTVIFNYYGIII